MSPGANVRTIHTLEDLRSALVRFGVETQEALRAMEQETRRTQEFLAQVEARWKREVQRREEIVRQAASALAACQASGYRDQEGHYHPPDCRAQEQTLLRARRYLAEAQAKLRETREWIRLVRQAAQDYAREGRRLAGLLAEDLPKASVQLERKVAILRSYTALSAPSAAEPSTISSSPAAAAGSASTAAPFADTTTPAAVDASLATTPPIQAATDVMAAGALLAAMGVGVVGVAVVQWLARDLRQALGDVGEDLSARLLKEQFQWQELPFDQPKHGFDRVFTAPGAPIIIVESKVHQKGEFHPGQTQHGEQGSPEWIAAQAQKMADPDSAQWSPANERLAALIQEIGPENVPVVAVVIETESGRADVYYRQGEVTWQPLRQDISLSEALTSAAEKATQLPLPGGREREPGPEMGEGGVGSVERRR